jgi:serine/threonine protein kinase/tetratricopeptide (TPR) repeat protein
MSDQTPHEESIFAQALACPASERAAYLNKVCAGDAQLRARLDNLLRAHDRGGSLLDDAPGAALRTALGRPAPEEAPGDHIGRYKLLQKIGEGGCGVVYMAEQVAPVRRRVALKVIKLGMDTKEIVARFEAERQALAMMDHPNIAKVLDGGATDTGRPFFVMELVRGVPITKFCDEGNFATAGRLNLFTQVCHAIQHAHQKGIIHRDIKPSNILVTLHDGVPVPKVIDFGIAKATQGQLTEKTVFTAFEQFIGTPAYMSPEQAEMSGLDIDTRSDIYSLGVLLYELLTGRPPFDPKTFLKVGLDEMRRIIREVDPPKPSTSLSTLAGVDRSTIARLRGIAPTQLSTLLRGDLDWIVMKALEKNRTNRYATPNDLAADLQRHLSDEPIIACPPSVAYRLRKFVDRNRFLVVTAASILVALIIGTGVATWQAVRATRAENEAKKQAAKSGQAFKFMGGMLAGVGPSVAAGRDTTLLREILDDTIRRLDQTMKDQPEVGANIRTKLAAVYIDVGDLAKGEALAREALAGSEKIYGRKGEDVALALATLAMARLRQVQGAESETLVREALAMVRQLPGAHPDKIGPDLLLLGMALAQQGKLPEAEAALRGALAIARAHPDLEELSVDAILTQLASVLQKEGRLGEAEPMLREALDLQEKRLGREHPLVGYSKAELAKVLVAQRKFPESEAAMREALSVLEKSFGPEHPNLWDFRLNQALIALHLRKPAEAEAMVQELIAIKGKVLGREHPDVLHSRAWLVEALKQQGKSGEAEVQESQMLASNRKMNGSDELAAANRQLYAAAMAQQQGKWAEVEAIIRAALPVFERAKGRSHPDTLGYRTMLARAIYQQQRPAESEAIEREIVADSRQAFGDKSTFVTTALAMLGRSLYQQGKLAEAETCFREALAIAKTQTTDGTGAGDALLVLATLRARLGNATEASTLAKEAAALSSKMPETQRGGGVNLLNPVIEALLQQNKLAEAEVMQRTILEFIVARDGRNGNWLAGVSVFLAKTLIREGRFAEAEPLAREGWELRKKLWPATNWRVPEAQSVLGEIQLGAKYFSEAEASLTEAFESMQQNQPKNPNGVVAWRLRLREVAGLLVKLYGETDQPAKAAAWQQKAAANTDPATYPPPTK